MNRRLNPELFNTSANTEDMAPMAQSVVATRKMEEQLRATNKRVSHLESLLEVLQSQLKTMTESTEQRTAAFSKAISSLEQNFREQDLTQAKQLKMIEERIRDQKITDGQVEHMVDRFNSSLTQFEVKISSLQKIINEKEMTLMSYRRIIEQIVDEVEKIKGQRGSNIQPPRF